MANDRNENELCTLGTPSNPNQEPCNTHPGGALIFYIGLETPTLIALESRKHCGELFPSKFTRITEHLEWIGDVTGIPPVFP